VKPEDITNKIFTISGEQAHYLSDVRRFKTNDEIMIFDGIGNSYEAKITSISKNEIVGNILSSFHKTPDFVINLYISTPKSHRFEWLIEKCAEIGVSEIVPIFTKRSINVNFSKNKAARYEKISIAASSQCQRNDIMKINSPLDFKTACKNAIVNKKFINILPWESEHENILNNLPVESTSTGANVFIGPEGGFENEEVEFAKSLGIHTITLGNNILRIETAAIAASILLLNFQKSIRQNQNS
jgi:16S rRNA (uracil1498-N3)-methyltransferase